MTVELRFRVARRAFELDVDFAFPARGFTALVGPSGGGKTTLLRLIAGLERDPTGRCVVGGTVWQADGSFVPTHERGVGLVFQHAELFEHLSVRGNLQFAARRAPTDGPIPVRQDDVVGWLALEPLLDRDPAHLSGGERQRVAIGRTLLSAPRLLLMDEPLSSLDATSKAEILPYLERLQRELDLPVLYVSHAMDEVARLADHIVALEAGQVTANGPLFETLTALDQPLSKQADAEAVIEAAVAEHDDEFQLTTLDYGPGELVVGRTDLPSGATVRVRIRASDVSLTLERPRATSILNVLPARVVGVRDDGAGRCTVALDVGSGGVILARVTRRSAVSLGLAIGGEVFAQVKSVALLGRS